ncbi:MAG TPA: helix-turn-helix transcriptional regulator [Mycobacterium sp.]|uniref:helix-turn-helix domain-containing protein n=1 Tax=Mycobacterium sp. TaxID=1785 RepID=UPI002F410769
MTDIPAAIQRAIAANVRAERARARLSQEDVAGGMRERGFGYWRQQTTGATERGERRITADELVALAAVLQVSTEALLEVPQLDAQIAPELVKYP